MLVLNLGRRLAELAADVAQTGQGARDPAAAPWRRGGGTHPTAPLAPPAHAIGDRAVHLDDPTVRHLIGVIRVAVVGGPGPLGEALTEDARGWSPAFSFAARAEAETALRDQVIPVTVLSFDVDALFWADPFAFVEWRLDATVDDPLLVADDVLIEAQGSPLALSGATVAELRGGRIAVVHTYYDDAALIEQIILGC